MDFQTLLNPPVFCSCCKEPRGFETQAELQNHESGKPHKCEECGKRFKKKGDMQRHSRQHSSRECWACQNINKTENLFLVKENACGYCGELIADDTRRAHLENVHGYNVCHATNPFKRQGNLLQHLYLVHSAVKGIRRTRISFNEFSSNKT
ncbi:hypothetical protein BU26DRAFT_514181, partial [Trematosphaeria pertusa]